MPIKRNKDRSLLKSRLRLRCSHVRDRRASGFDDGGRHHYYDVFLWSTAQAARDNVLDAVDGAMGWHCCGSWRERVDSNGEDGDIIAPPKLGELHFVAGNWTEEIVSHELYHASIHLQRLWPTTARCATNQDPMEAEELLCYRFGRMFSELYRWLWELDPGRRSGASRAV